MDMSRFQVNVIKFHNPTGEVLRTSHEGRPYTFFPNSYTNVQAQHAYAIAEKWQHRGIYPLLPGEDHESIKMNALRAYTTWTAARIANYQTFLDVRKVAGFNDLEPKKLKQFKKWHAELTEILGATKEEENMHSFLSPAIMEAAPTHELDALVGQSQRLAKAKAPVKKAAPKVEPKPEPLLSEAE